ncbi:S26 family signal peptidase [Acidithiobacillus thiooxidans]|uniref:S26 family signal peptidase n=1 Tax=Acidithiobacillus thiooxidans TaxID=930 RepID=UPI000A4668FD|nr:S26 family signal peptidase [Acidithiobacillus thiooxidans]
MRIPACFAGGFFFFWCYIHGMKALHRKDQWIIGGIALALIAGGCATAAIRQGRLTLNASPCVPVGVYQIIPIKKPLHDGEWVRFCPPLAPSVRQEVRHHWMDLSASSICADHLVPFIKHVVAVPGQTVTLSAEGMAVDGLHLSPPAGPAKGLHPAKGHLIPHTAVQFTAPTLNQHVHLIHYPFGTYTVKPGTFWEVATGTKWAFDSRYYGPIPNSAILSGARPIWTWKETP